MAERADREVEVLEWRAVVALAFAAAGAAQDAPETYERRKRTAEDAERQVRGHARRKTARWAAGVLADPTAVVLSFATARSGGRVDELEVAVLDTGGRTLLHGRARSDLDPADVRPRLRDCLSEALAPAGSGRRVVVFDRPPVLRLLARHAPGVLRALSREARGTGRGGGPGESDDAGDAAFIEDARKHFYRAYGEWNSATEDYCDCTFLPGRDGTALGEARATLALVKKLTDERGACAPGGPGLGCLCVPKGTPEPGLCPLCEGAWSAEDDLAFLGDTLVCRGCAEAAEAF